MIKLEMESDWVKVNDEKTVKSARDIIMLMLSNNVCKLKFEKKDGTLKETMATMKKSFIPEVKGSADPKKENTEVVTYIDVDAFKANEDKAKAWRSFKLEGLRSIEISA